MLHLLVGQAGTNCDLRLLGVNLYRFEFIDSPQSNDIGWLAMVEINFNHQVGATLDKLRRRVGRGRLQGILKCAWH